MNQPSFPQRVYCIGLAGVGVSAVARLLRARGAQVSGSDPHRTPIIDDLVQAGVRYFPQPDPRRLTAEFDLVVATDDAPADHPERLAAQRLGIPCENFSVTLGRLMADVPQRITIAGTNGKSTTTAMTGLLLADAGLDPTVMVGSRVPEFSGNVRIGAGATVVVEADEYRDHFLNYHPTVAVITNMEADHLDYFGDLAGMRDSYNRYLARLPADGNIIVNADDADCRSLVQGRPNVLTFGLNHPADLMARQVSVSNGQQTWETVYHETSWGLMRLRLPGRFNIANALAAMAAAQAVGCAPTTFAETLAAFHGIWRRFQILNPGGPTLIVSDYAHHPTAVRVTLDGAREFYPGRRLIAVFQPHHRSRLTALFDDFTKSFSAADETLIVETYSVPGRDVPERTTKSARQLVDALQHRGQSVQYADSLTQADAQLRARLRPGDVAVIMGAGDIWQTAESLAHDYA